MEKNWDFLRTTSTIFSLSIDHEKNILYTAGHDGFGKIERDNRYTLTHTALSDSSARGSDIFSSVFKENTLYGISKDTLYILDLTTKKTRTIHPKYGGSLTGLFIVNDKILVNNTVSGLLELDGNTLSDPALLALRGVYPSLLSPSPDSSRWLVDDEFGKLSLLHGDRLDRITISEEEQDYLTENEVISGIWVSDTVAAIATLKGGVVFLNPISGKIDQIINYESGLPDNEVYAMALDRERSIWIAHKNGFTLVSPSLFFRNFSSYQGLRGDLLSVIHHRDTLYVGTSLGLYYLETVREYDEETYFERKRVPVTDDQHSGKTATLDGPVRQLQSGQTGKADELQKISKKEDSRRGLLGFLKGRKREKTTIKNNGIPPADANSNVEAQSAEAKKPAKSAIIVKLEKKDQKKKLRSIRYVYRKIDRVDSKVFHLVVNSGKLFSSGLDGLFEISNKTAKAITKKPVRSLYISKHHNSIFANTYNDFIKVYDLQGLHEEEYMFGDFKSNVQHIFEDGQHRVWFCSTDRLFWVEIEQGENCRNGRACY